MARVEEDDLVVESAGVDPGEVLGREQHDRPQLEGGSGRVVAYLGIGFPSSDRGQPELTGGLDVDERHVSDLDTGGAESFEPRRLDLGVLEVGPKITGRQRGDAVTVVARDATVGRNMHRVVLAEGPELREPDVAFDHVVRSSVDDPSDSVLVVVDAEKDRLHLIGAVGVPRSAQFPLP